MVNTETLGYTRYEWMQGKARRTVDGKSRMTDIWDSKTRRQKHEDGTAVQQLTLIWKL